jgi:hypothetical protein
LNRVGPGGAELVTASGPVGMVGAGGRGRRCGRRRRLVRRVGGRYLPPVARTGADCAAAQVGPYSTPFVRRGTGGHRGRGRGCAGWRAGVVANITVGTPGPGSYGMACDQPWPGVSSVNFSRAGHREPGDGHGRRRGVVGAGRRGSADVGRHRRLYGGDGGDRSALSTPAGPGLTAGEQVGPYSTPFVGRGRDVVVPAVPGCGRRTRSCERDGRKPDRQRVRHVAAGQSRPLASR